MGKSFLNIIAVCICVLSFCGCGSIDRAVDEDRRQNDVAVSAYNTELEGVKIGMTESQIVGLLGNPSGDNVTRTAAGKSEQWIYTGPSLFIHAGYYLSRCYYSTEVQYQNVEIYLYFENGILTSTQGF
jgi:hypothetical protein